LLRGGLKMVVNKNLNYLEKFLGINEETVVKAVVKGKLRTKKYEIKADYIEDGISLLVTDLKGEEVFFRGLVVDFRDEIRKLWNMNYVSNTVDLGKLVVYYRDRKYVIKERRYIERSDMIIEIPILETENFGKVVRTVKKVLGVK